MPLPTATGDWTYCDLMLQQCPCLACSTYPVSLVASATVPWPSPGSHQTPTHPGHPALATPLSSPLSCTLTMYPPASWPPPCTLTVYPNCIPSWPPHYPHRAPFRALPPAAWTRMPMPRACLRPAEWSSSVPRATARTWGCTGRGWAHWSRCAQTRGYVRGFGGVRGKERASDKEEGGGSVVCLVM